MVPRIPPKIKGIEDSIGPKKDVAKRSGSEANGNDVEQLPEAAKPAGHRVAAQTGTSKG